MKTRGNTVRRFGKRTGKNVCANAEALESRTLLSVNVLTWHDDLARTGLNSQETQLTPANVHAGSFGKLFSYPVDGQQYAEPLYVSNLNMGALGTHDVVFVATMNNSVYAFDADSNAGPNGGLLWHVNFGPPATTPSPYIGGRYGPWTLIYPYIGNEGTPVIDLATNTIYLDSFTNDGPGLYSHHIHALNITTGAERPNSPVLVTANYPGNGAGGNGTTIPFIANRQQQRPALTLLNGIVYAAYGSFDDTDPHHGWILGYDAATLQLKQVWNSTPTLFTPPGTNPGEGPIWQSGAGLSSDGSNLYAMTGNGDFNASLNDYADSFVKVSTANNTLALTDYFTPYNQQQLTDADNDLGSAGPLVLDVPGAAHPHLLIGVGKQGIIWVLNRDNLGQFTPTAPDHVLQEVSLGSGAWSNPAYYNGRVYFHGVGDVIKAFAITSSGLLSTTPVAQGTISYAYPGATPSISSNGTSNGIVWDLQSNGTGTLHAYDPTTLAELYNSNQNPGDALGSYVKFTTPTIADGKVFVGTMDSVAIFGLLPQGSIVGTGGNDTITLKQDADHQHIDWTFGAAAGQVLINSPTGLTINGFGGQDTLNLDSTNGDPLPNHLTLSGNFTINGLTAVIFAPGQSIDMGSGTITIPYVGTSPLATIQALLRSGYNGGSWNGTGIISSTARANPDYGIADTDSANGGAPGQRASTIQLRYALVGDADQNGQVNFNDLLQLAQRYGTTGNDWSQGDFDYSGSIGFADLLLLAQHYGRQLPTWPNLLQNGNFSQGNTGFTSGYNWSTDLNPESNYTVGTNPSIYHNAGVANFGDHTTGSGQMLILNGATTANVTVWQESVAVTPGTLYSFAGWARSWGGTTTDPSPAVLRLQINGQTIGTDFQLSGALDHWSQFSWAWNSGSAKVATIRIIDVNTVSTGNDYAIDDLSLLATPPGAAATQVVSPDTLSAIKRAKTLLHPLLTPPKSVRR